MSYIDLVRQDRRLVILRLTAEGSGTSNDSLLRRGLQQWGLPCSRQGLAEDLRFLAGENLVTLTDLPENHQRIDITGRGRDVVEGALEVGGITKPALVRG